MICRKCGTTFEPTSGTIDNTCINCSPTTNIHVQADVYKQEAIEYLKYKTVLDELEKAIILQKAVAKKYNKKPVIEEINNIQNNIKYLKTKHGIKDGKE